MFTLYQYLHCPFCVRADMVANYTGVPHKKVLLLNDDDETCHKLIGKKMVPILQPDDGSAMGESLDIVDKILSLAPADKQLQPAQQAEKVSTLLSEYSSDMNGLLFPRNILIDQPEFATVSARDYFQAKKEKAIAMTFTEAMSKTDHYIGRVNEMLSKLPPLKASASLGMDDVLTFPFLRNLTMVKGLDWPQPVKQYVDDIAALTDIHLYWQQAV
ncbi:glutaredoxin 2 [Alteromonas sp. ZYF713]|nr:glutaredoxin 2 [Alteromonas sp. ZYF713]